jgi:lysozyme
MELSTKGMIDIIDREGIALSWYLDSVGVPTIGVGETKSDGIDPRLRGTMTLQEAIDSFGKKIKQYTDALDALRLDLNQTQYDALASFCYNVGPGNLRTLCAHRTVNQIGPAIMLYLRPPEIKQRRLGEQRLFLHGTYTNTDGKVLVFPVSSTHHPDYHHGQMVDIRSFFNPNTGVQA